MPEGQPSGAIDQNVSATVPVTVVIPLYHAADRHLRRLAASLSTQGAAEVIVVIDDDSEPAAVAAQLAPVPNLKVIVSDGNGAGMARNCGVAAASQAWIAFLDHDDWWPPRFLADLLADAAANVVGYDSEVFTEEDGEPTASGETLFDRVDWDREEIDAASSALLLDRFPLLKVVLRREAFDAIGGYRPLFAVQDFDLAWRLIASGERIELRRHPRGAYLVHGSGITGTVSGSREGFERAQLCWVAIWGGMARSPGLPAAVRAQAAVKLSRVRARILARRFRDRARTLRRSR